jgi:YbbR domain-containing protein
VKRLLPSVTRNAAWKLFSLLVAVLLWISVSSEPELSTFSTVPLQYKDLPVELEISSNLIESVTLELRGPAGDLREFTGSPTAVVLDMARAQPGERTFIVRADNVQLPRGLQLVRAIPSQVRFYFERRTTRDVPVQVRFSEDPPKGYQVVGYAITPHRMRVVGPESRVRKVDHAVTDPIDLSPVVGVQEFRVNTFTEDPLVRFQSPPQVVVRVTVQRKREPHG